MYLFNLTIHWEWISPNRLICLKVEGRIWIRFAFVVDWNGRRSGVSLSVEGDFDLRWAIVRNSIHLINVFVRFVFNQEVLVILKDLRFRVILRILFVVIVDWCLGVRLLWRLSVWEHWLRIVLMQWKILEQITDFKCSAAHITWNLISTNILKRYGSDEQSDGRLLELKQLCELLVVAELASNLCHWVSILQFKVRRNILEFLENKVVYAIQLNIHIHISSYFLS